MATKKAPAKKAAAKKAVKAVAKKGGPTTLAARVNPQSAGALKAALPKKPKKPAKRIAKKATARTQAASIAAKVTPDRVRHDAPDEIVSLAKDVLAGVHGTGRERDTAIRNLGYDPAAVQKEAARQRRQ